jgi:hypothetical protein
MSLHRLHDPQDGVAINILQKEVDQMCIPEHGSVGKLDYPSEVPVPIRIQVIFREEESV